MTVLMTLFPSFSFYLLRTVINFNTFRKKVPTDLHGYTCRLVIIYNQSFQVPFMGNHRHLMYKMSNIVKRIVELYNNHQVLGKVILKN